MLACGEQPLGVWQHRARGQPGQARQDWAALEKARDDALSCICSPLVHHVPLNEKSVFVFRLVTAAAESTAAFLRSYDGEFKAAYGVLFGERRLWRGNLTIRVSDWDNIIPLQLRVIGVDAAGTISLVIGPEVVAAKLENGAKLSWGADGGRFSTEIVGDSMSGGGMGRGWEATITLSTHSTSLS